MRCAPFAGQIEYWSPSSFRFPDDDVAFRSKLDTDLYTLAKAKTVAHSLDVSRDGSQFLVFSFDRYVLHSHGHSNRCAARVPSCVGPVESVAHQIRSPQRVRCARCCRTWQRCSRSRSYMAQCGSYISSAHHWLSTLSSALWPVEHNTSNTRAGQFCYPLCRLTATPADLRRRVRVFRFATGKLRRTYDESIEAANQMQRSDSDLYRLDPIDWGRRVAAVCGPTGPCQHAMLTGACFTAVHLHSGRCACVARTPYVVQLRNMGRGVCADASRALCRAPGRDDVRQTRCGALWSPGQDHNCTSCWPSCIQERELTADESAPPPNAVFDDSGNFVLYPTLLGIKVGPWKALFPGSYPQRVAPVRHGLGSALVPA